VEVEIHDYQLPSKPGSTTYRYSISSTRGSYVNVNVGLHIRETEDAPEIEISATIPIAVAPNATLDSLYEAAENKLLHYISRDNLP
jgi:hypothetical protein